MRKKVPTISVVIVTKNRPRDVAECLISLQSQTVMPDEVVVIDNSTNTKTQQFIQKQKKKFTFPFRSYRERISNYPRVYNQGLHRTRGEWVAFIDDDCVADPEWFAVLRSEVTRASNTQVVLGLSGTYFSKNIFSLATYLFNADWKEQWVKKNRVINCEILDNKNIAYQKNFLLQHHIQFDERRAEILGGAAEDCDLGLQIQLHGGKAVYSRKMKVVHKDPTHWQYYWRKYFTSLAAYRYFLLGSAQDEGRRQLLNQLQALKPTRPRGTFRRLALQVRSNAKLSLGQELLFFLLVYTTVGMSFVLRWLFQFPSFQKWYINRV